MLVVFEKGRKGDPITFIDGLPAFPPKGSVDLGDLELKTILGVVVSSSQ